MERMGERLRQARINAGFESAKSAAERFGWVISTYSAHENGQNGFKPKAAAEYAKAFKCSQAWLLTGEGISPAEAPEMDASAEARRLRSAAEERLRLLPPEALKTVLDHMDFLLSRGRER